MASDERNIETSSVLFIKKKFLDNYTKYSDCAIINLEWMNKYKLLIKLGNHLIII